MSNIKLTPNQLSIINEHVLNIFTHNISIHMTGEPHYEHVNIDGNRYKIGLLPGGEGDKTVLSIKIVCKGKI